MATVRDPRMAYSENGMRRAMMIATVIVPILALATVIVGVAVSNANGSRDIRENKIRIERAHTKIDTLKLVDKEIAQVIVDIRLQMAKVDVRLEAVQKELELSRKLRENGH